MNNFDLFLNINNFKFMIYNILGIKNVHIFVMIKHKLRGNF